MDLEIIDPLKCRRVFKNRVYFTKTSNGYISRSRL